MVEILACKVDYGHYLLPVSGNGQTSSPEFSAFSKVKPDLVKQLNFNFLQLKEQCQAAGLMTFAEVQANFGGRSPSPTEDMSLLLEIVLSRIRLDPSLYSKFMGLPLLQDPVHGEVVSQMGQCVLLVQRPVLLLRILSAGNILEDERAEEHRSPATLGMELKISLIRNGMSKEHLVSWQ